MALIDYYNTGDTGNIGPNAAFWIAQTFTALQTYTAKRVRIKGGVTGLPGDIIVSIRPTLGNGYPTAGPDLASKTLSGNGFGSVYLWREFIFDCDLVLGVKYALVVRVPNGNPTNKFNWRHLATSPTYAYGSQFTSNNSGVDWTEYIGRDCMFEIYDALAKKVKAKSGKFLMGGYW